MVSTFALVSANVLIINVWAKSLGQYTGIKVVYFRISILKFDSSDRHLPFSIQTIITKDHIVCC